MTNTMSESVPDLFYKIVLNEVEEALATKQGDTPCAAKKRGIVEMLREESRLYGFTPDQGEYVGRLNDERTKWYKAFVAAVPLDTLDSNPQRMRREILTTMVNQYQ